MSQVIFATLFCFTRLFKISTKTSDIKLRNILKHDEEINKLRNLRKTVRKQASSYLNLLNGTNMSGNDDNEQNKDEQEDKGKTKDDEVKDDEKKESKNDIEKRRGLRRFSFVKQFSRKSSSSTGTELMNNDSNNNSDNVNSNHKQKRRISLKRFSINMNYNDDRASTAPKSIASTTAKMSSASSADASSNTSTSSTDNEHAIMQKHQPTHKQSNTSYYLFNNKNYIYIGTCILYLICVGIVIISRIWYTPTAIIRA